MKNLLKLQEEFANHLYQKSDKKILQKLPYEPAEALARLNIYRNNVFGNFESVLSSIFVVTKKILGEKNFDDLVKRFCQKNFSESGNLDEYGLNFPQFLKRQKPTWLKDLAQLELLRHQSYFLAETEKEFDVKNFKKLSPEKFSELIFTLDSGCILFSSKFSICSIWQKKQKIKQPLKPEFALVFNYNISKISEEEFLFLSLIKDGKKLFKIYKTIVRKTKKEVDIGKLLNRFISNGIIKNYAGI
jgi:hypothetical protein